MLSTLHKGQIMQVLFRCSISVVSSLRGIQTPALWRSLSGPQYMVRKLDVLTQGFRQLTDALDNVCKLCKFMQCMQISTIYIYFCKFTPFCQCDCVFEHLLFRVSAQNSGTRRAAVSSENSWIFSKYGNI